MTDRTSSPAFAALSRSARKVLAAIEAAIGDGSSASVSYVDFRLDHGIGRKSVSPSLKLPDHLGLVDIEPGSRCGNVFRLSNQWRTIDEVEAVRLAAAAITSSARVGSGWRRHGETERLRSVETKVRLGRLLDRNVGFPWRVQLVAATHSANFSAGV
jgi:hypothetical protein